MVVIPYYLHNYEKFHRITILGEFLAVGALVMCLLFIVVDLGQPTRMLNVLLYPSPKSILFYDMLVLNGYLLINVLISRITLDAEKKGIPPPIWIKWVIYLSIPWAISIHTVTAFLYQGLAARPFWMTAIMAPRFLASAFSAGPALLIILCLILRKTTKFDVGTKPIQKLAQIVTYAMILNVFFVAMELFSGIYSSIPEHTSHFEFLFLGYDGNNTMVPWMWVSTVLAIISLVLLINPKTRKDETTLVFACIAVYLSLWIDKGLGLVIAGMTPTPLHTVVDYWPTAIEAGVAMGVYAMGALIITALYRMVLTIRRETV